MHTLELSCGTTKEHNYMAAVNMLAQRLHSGVWTQESIKHPTHAVIKGF